MKTFCPSIPSGSAGPAFWPDRCASSCSAAYFGLIPAIFSCVFVSARGDRTATWTNSLVLATVVTAFGVGLFSYVLQVPMPLLTWRGL